LEDLQGNLRAKVWKTFQEILEPRLGRPSGKSSQGLEDLQGSLRINTAKACKSFRKYIFQENPKNFPKDFGHLKLTGSEQLLLDAKVQNIETVNVFSFQRILNDCQEAFRYHVK
jgi:hypothetical protein